MEILQDDVSKNCKADTFKYVGKGPPLPDLNPSQSNCVLNNGMIHSLALMAPTISYTGYNNLRAKVR